MCTVTFIARKNGFALGMNRDEKLSRAKGLPPKIISRGGRKIICPSESGGGTWVAANDARAAFALINWYAVKTAVKNIPVSRGIIVNSLATAATTDAAVKILARLPLKRINPFRLIGIFPAEKKVFEWRWNLKTLAAIPHRWETNIWISSGFDERAARESRGKVFAAALAQKSAGTIAWLRRLHRSHKPKRGPGCICMHRADAATVSYSEIILGGKKIQMRHTEGAPCEAVLNPFVVLPFCCV